MSLSCRLESSLIYNRQHPFAYEVFNRHKFRFQIREIAAPYGKHKPLSYNYFGKDSTLTTHCLLHIFQRRNGPLVQIKLTK